MDEPVTLVVNGSPAEVRADPDTPLLYLLRNDLGLKGTRFGCGEGLCGACTVLIDGRAAYSCNTPLWAVSGKAITTIEGLGGAGCLGSVQTALLGARAGQCGYCLAGIVMRLQGALADPRQLRRQEIVTELSKNLCRCGTHPRVLRALDALLAEQSSRSPS
jgi:nicotinate dehydrogenase subunit A